MKKIPPLVVILVSPVDLLIPPPVLILCVSGGYENTASGGGSSIWGGFNTATDIFSCVSGGGQYPLGEHSSVAGGSGNDTLEEKSSVFGGMGNTASGALSSVSGGRITPPLEPILQYGEDMKIQLLDIIHPFWLDGQYRLGFLFICRGRSTTPPQEIFYSLRRAEQHRFRRKVLRIWRIWKYLLACYPLYQVDL